MRLQDIMNTNIKTISLDESIVVANDIMWRQRIHHLVVKQGDQVVGVISDTDLGGAEATDIPDDQKVSDRMHSQLITAEPTTTLKRAAAIFQERKIHCLPVMDKGNLVGMVTSADLEELEKRGVPEHIPIHNVEFNTEMPNHPRHPRHYHMP